MKISTKTIVTVGMFTAVLAVLSILQIPMPTGVPITLQTFAMALCGYVLGWQLGISATLLYMISTGGNLKQMIPDQRQVVHMHPLARADGFCRPADNRAVFDDRFALARGAGPHPLGSGLVRSRGAGGAFPDGPASGGAHGRGNRRGG